MQNNYLSDPMEAARLTQTPNFHRLWVKHNPLTRKYKDYRITMFNVFRSTPGNLQDIVIDDYAPGYTERKYLVERAPELESHQVPRLTQIIEPPVMEQEIAEVDSGQGKTAVGADRVNGDNARNRSTRRRRIVDLSRDESRFISPAKEAGGDAKSSAETNRPKHLVEMHAASTGDIPASTPFVELSGNSESLQDVMPQTSAQPDDYRLKVEALREEFGSNWISVLSERGYGGDLRLATGNGAILHHSPLQRSNTHVIVSGGRTLG